jgi:hypothetical protein
MQPLEITKDLVGTEVTVPNRPEWGRGKVLRVQTTEAGGQPQHRVSVQFATGHRTLVVPPAKLVAPDAAVEEAREDEVGWLDSISGRSPDERLTALSEDLQYFLGTPAQKMIALAELYALNDEPATLVKWARRQANVADPLTHWSRDELAKAFAAFCMERDSVLREAAARLKMAEGPEAIQQVLATLPAEIREGMLGALRRVI